MEREYRYLRISEIDILQSNGCQAEDWTDIMVEENFSPEHIRNVAFYGKIRLGFFDKKIEIAPSFFVHAGIRNASLHNVTIGNNCLIENVGRYISNYTIGEECYISNVGNVESSAGATFGQGHMISVLNEMGTGNVMIFDKLTSQIASLCIRYASDEVFMSNIKHLIRLYIEENVNSIGTIEDNVTITNTHDITNVHIGSGCNINGANRINDCTIKSSFDSETYIGSNVICENCVISRGATVIDHANIFNCFIGERCHISNGFTAENSIFFANSHMANGEACSSFCGPFSSSHHKSTLLIGGEYSFYNAGSATNFSNHAYKMGPMHYGTLDRGTKTASGSYILLPAHIGAFSVCFGKIMHHPDTTELPFSYAIGNEQTTYIVPGSNISTIGLYRDVNKWRVRDKRPLEERQDIINFDWLSPFTVGNIIKGKEILKELLNSENADTQEFNYQQCKIKKASLLKGIKRYDMVIRMYMGKMLKIYKTTIPQCEICVDDWIDLSGLYMPASEEERMVSVIRNEGCRTIYDLMQIIENIHSNYDIYKWAWTYNMILRYYDLDSLSTDDIDKIIEEGQAATRSWVADIRQDAQKEYELGDVDKNILYKIMETLDQELDDNT